ncbi:MAG TPA: TonB-dependent receptor [Stellaceae bacterium]|nr:TonB-dependent receptor [Stellaceae bacterium]
MRNALFATAFLLALPRAVAAQTQPLPEIDVIGTTPLPGLGIDADKVPGTVQTLHAEDLSREGSASVVTALQDQVSGVAINDTLSDGFQPDILYHGFEASPVLGTPQGLAVYQNGVRVNEAFGDTVNWDLIPDIAIDRIDLVGSNPVYGLNALGGAVSLTMKNGFGYHGSETELTGGSFGRRGLSFQYGQQAGQFAGYIAARGLDEGGYRHFSKNSLGQLYADLGARNERAAIDISFSGANNHLYGPGTAPVQELDINPALTFTGPQHDFDQLAFVTVNGSYQASDTLSFQGDAYRREFRQTVANGNTTNYAACAPANGFLCQSDGTTVLLGVHGNPIPDISNGGTQPIGENDAEAIRTVTLGAALQATESDAVLGRDNHLVGGASVDHATTDFQSTTEVGAIDSSLFVLPGYVVATPENSGFNATPVGLRATTDYYGLFVTDTYDLTPALSITASGRFNLAELALVDGEGAQLSGNSQYRRFNPAIGATYKVTPNLTAYAGYSEANRVPTPSEIECSNPAQPCLLPSSLSSDPPNLKQVVAHTYEAGWRGKFALEELPGGFSWNLGFYRTDLDDDIYGVASSIGSGFFENIGATRRQGIDAGLGYKDARWSAKLSYSLVDATFQSPLTLPSPSNPAADANGNIQVRPGDHLPGIPEHRVTLSADYHITEAWILGATATYTGAQYYRGDESNQNAPLPGYALVNLHSSYKLAAHIELFATVDNIFDTRYATFGQYGDPAGVGVPGVPAGAPANGPGVDNRFQSPGAPIAAFAGIRAQF